MEIVERCVNAAQMFANGRQVAIWGGLKYQEEIRKKLAKVNITTMIFDTDDKKVDGVNVYYPFFENIYILIPMYFYSEVKLELIKNGLHRDYDYYCPYDDVISDTVDYYEDKRGNRIFGNRSGMDIIFRGEGATVRIDGSGKRSCRIFASDRSVIIIGNECDIGKGTEISVMEDAVLSISKGCTLYNGLLFRVLNGANVNIGENTTISHFSLIYADPETILTIGNDCMFSMYTIIKTADGHSIYNVETGKQINYPIGKSIIIGDHVWLGIRNTVFGNTVIGEGSVVGAESLVKGQYPNNCILAGKPAKVIRKNIAWSRKYYSDGIIDAENVFMTIDEDNK